MQRHVLRLRSTISQSAAYTTSPYEPLYVSAQIAEAVGFQGSRLTQLPADVAAAIDAAAADSNRKAVRQNSRDLTDKLKRMSRTKHRGGTHPNYYDTPPDHEITRSLRGKLRQQEHRALAQLTQHAPRLIEDDEALPKSFWDGHERPVTQLLDTMASEVRESTAAHSAAGGGLYDESSAMAYAATRMPAGYAALHRVLREVQRAAPLGWRPESILDFGAGPGTGTWAAHSIWSKAGTSPLQVTAVEPSGAMAWLGQAIQQRLLSTYETANMRPAVVQKKNGDWGNSTPERISQADDEVQKGAAKETAEDSLFKESGDGAKAQLVPPPAVRWMTRLFSQRGSSSNSSSSSNSGGRKYDVVIAGYVLGEVPTVRERRKLLTDLWRRTGKYLILVEPGTPAGSETIHTARAQILQDAARDAGGGPAHVAAPCPHDGACPLQHRPSWCHFVQRFERPAVLRRAKMLAGKAPPRSHQDEKFSYLVLARGPRDHVSKQVRVAGTFPPAENDLSSEYTSIPEDLKPKSIGIAASSSSSSSSFLPEEQSEMLSSDLDTEYDEQDRDNEDLGSLEDESESDDDDSIPNGIGIKARIGNKSDEAIEEEIRRMLFDSLDEEVLEDGKLPPELEEVIQRSLEDMRRDRAAKGGQGSTDLEREEEDINDFEISSSGSESESEEETSEAGTPTDSDSDSGSAAMLSKKEERALLGYGAEDLEAEVATRTASRAWSRLLRQPRKRSGHVVMDICSAVDAQGRYLGGDEGVLLRHIVSKGKAARETGGIAPFKLARRARWGDLWPLHYQNAMKTFEPPSGLDEN